MKKNKKSKNPYTETNLSQWSSYIQKNSILFFGLFLLVSCGTWGIVEIAETYDNGNVKIKEKIDKNGLYQKITFTENGDTLKIENFKDGKIIETIDY